MKRITFFLLFFSIGLSVQAQEQEKVKEAMFNYLNGFYKGDSSLIIASVDTNVYKYGYFMQNGSYRGTRMTYKEMIAFTRNVKDGKIKFPANARAEAVVFEVNDKTALGKVFADWGFDYILLAKQNDRWMIRQILWQNYPPAK